MYNRVFFGNREVSSIYRGVDRIFRKQSGYLPETNLVIEYGNDHSYLIPTAPYLDKLNGHIRDMIDFNLFGEIDLDYWMVGDGDMNFKTINIIDPDKYKGTVTGLINEVGGIKGDGTGFIATGFSVTGSEKYTLNLAGRGAYVYNYVTSNIAGSILAGIAANATYNIIKTRNVGDSRINGSVNITVPVVLQGVGYTALNRTDSSTVIVNKELDVYADPSNTSSASFLDSEHLVFAAGGARGTNGISCYWSGSAIVGQDAINHRLSIINNL